MVEAPLDAADVASDQVVLLADGLVGEEQRLCQGHLPVARLVGGQCSRVCRVYLLDCGFQVTQFWSLNLLHLIKVKIREEN